MLTTSRLFLMPATLPMLEAAVARDWAKLSSLLGGVYFADNWNRFPEAMEWSLNRLKAHPEEAGWWGYFIIQGMDARVAGTCGFKGLPNASGAVEIGYEIADRYQNQGLATEAAKALVAHAFKQPTVKSVLAHTLPAESASTQVLRNLGFQYEGEVSDPEDGQVWRWRILKPVPAAVPPPKPATKPASKPASKPAPKKNKKK